LWPERLRIALRPDAVAIAVARGLQWGPPVLREVWNCEPRPGDPPWKECVSRLAADDGWNPRHATVAVVLSSHFCHFAFLEKPAAISSEAEALSYAQHRMLALYGDAAKDWALELSPSGRQSWLVCCTPQPLLNAIREVCAAKDARLVSIQPYFSAAWQRRAASLTGKGGWFVVHEPRHITVGRVARDRWVHLASRRSKDTLDAVLDVLDRERELVPEQPAAHNVWLYGSPLCDVPAEHRGYTLNVVAPPGASKIEITRRPLYAMAA
jgi:hypothetical protein